MRILSFVLFVIIILSACKGKTSNLAGNEKIEAEDFFSAFMVVKTPFTISDTSNKIATDTSVISFDVLQQFIPDSVIHNVFGKKAEKLNYLPAGDIKKGGEEYLLILSQRTQQEKLAVFVFNKKHQYLASLALLDLEKDNSYINSVAVNNEPTFTIIREKTVNNQYAYTKNGFAYNKEANAFVAVIKDSNEDTKKLSEVINPIDTLARKNKFSGDYVQDKKNFISLRDGNNATSYIFFIHFEKDNDACVGELKGIIKMIEAAKGIYEENGDLCTIDFKMSKALINVKERGNCGNHRGIKCYFNDTYQLKKSAKSLKKV